MKIREVAPIWLMALLCWVAFLWLLSHAASSVIAQSSGQGRELHETYDLAAGGTVAVTNTSGYIRVTSWNENRVKVDAVKRADRDEDVSQVEIQVTNTPDRVEIRTVYPRARPSRISVDYDLKVPRTAVLNGLTTTSGDISVTDPVARVTARATSGNITVRGVTGDAALSITSGRVTADRIGGSLGVTATSGEVVVGEVASTVSARCASCNISVRGARDDVTAQASSGNIEIERAGGRVTARATSGWVKINDVGGDVIAESYSESITVTNARGHVSANALSGGVVISKIGEGARVSAVSGSVEVNDAKGRLEIGATSGSITLNNIDSRDVSARANSGPVRFTGKIYDDGHYEFVSFSSQVVLMLPPESNFNLVAQTHSGSVNTEFPLRIPEGTRFGGRGPITGVVGRGGAQVRASSSSGSILIKKGTGQAR